MEYVARMESALACRLFAERLLTVIASCRQQGRPLLAFLAAAGEAAYPLRLPGAGARGQADLLPPVAPDHPGRGRVRRAAGQQVPLAFDGRRDHRPAGLPGPAAAGALLRRPRLRDDQLAAAGNSKRLHQLRHHRVHDDRQGRAAHYLAADALLPPRRSVYRRDHWARLSEEGERRRREPEGGDAVLRSDRQRPRRTANGPRPGHRRGR